MMFLWIPLNIVILAGLGQRAVRAEALRYAEMAEVARRKRLIRKPVRAAQAEGPA